VFNLTQSADAWCVTLKDEQMRNVLIAVVLIVAVALPSAQKLAVKIIDRQDNYGTYTYVVPGYSNSTTNTDVNCNGSGSNVNCNGSTRTSGASTPAAVRSYQVQGATLSLQLPDGRVAVINCRSKVDLGMSGAVRCRIPLVDDIQAEFDGDKAKLKWSVSIDGKTMESETYKILAVLAR
jgi:hypothetical protein